MSVTIEESGLLFGEYDEEKFFHIEKSSIYKSFEDKTRVVEFILYNKNNAILFVEAKSSSPKPGNQVEFDPYINEIYEKFSHSVDLFFSMVIKRTADYKNEMPAYFKSADYSSVEIKLVLVINGHETGWLSPITTALHNKLKRKIKIWRLQLIVLNHELAGKYGLLKP
jgi:hypothetical protein